MEETNTSFNTETITVPEFERNGTTYSSFEMRYPSFSEVSANYAIIAKAGTPEGNKAAAALTKLCTVNLKNKTDFEAFPSPVAFKLITWVGKHIV